jgi:hypothetical protein
MRKARDYHLNEQELQDIETAIHHDNRPEMRQRCTAIRLLHLALYATGSGQPCAAPADFDWFEYRFS